MSRDIIDPTVFHQTGFPPIIHSGQLRIFKLVVRVRDSSKGILAKTHTI